MTKTNRAYISQVRDIMKERFADTIASNKFIYNLLFTAAKELIKRESNALNLNKFQSLYQPLKCVEVIEAPTIDPCCGIKTLCKVWRTKDKLPPLYEDGAGVIIKNVSSIDDSFDYDIITPESIKRKLDNPWMKKYPSPKRFCFYRDGYLYFTERTLLVEVRGMFTRDIKKFNKCEDSTGCIMFLDETFFLPGYLENTLMKMVEEQLLKIYKQIPEDININKSNS